MSTLSFFVLVLCFLCGDSSRSWFVSGLSSFVLCFLSKDSSGLCLVTSLSSLFGFLCGDKDDSSRSSCLERLGVSTGALGFDSVEMLVSCWSRARLGNTAFAGGLFTG